MSDLYLWIKALHVISVVFWMAGLLFMPRLFAYHSSAQPGGELEVKMLGAEDRLQKIILNPAMIAAFIFGLALAVIQWPLSISLYIKFVVVFLLMGYHGFLSKTRKRFAAGERPKDEKYYRMINEVPSIAVIIIVILVVVKPF